MVFPAKGIMYDVNMMQHGQGSMADGRRYACSDLELNAMECMEAYGTIKGMTRCRPFFDDLHECRTQFYKKLRHKIMKQERLKQVLSGERKWSERYGHEYAYDSFFNNTFTP